ncbi:hypothetical protein BDB01DRAFT_833093 [Pilobolus umbonatus]|nr:hypothetical protein BDB01DRAFT_833093 [Pilobolus umbonatus]
MNTPMIDPTAVDWHSFATSESNKIPEKDTTPTTPIRSPGVLSPDCIDKITIPPTCFCGKPAYASAVNSENTVYECNLMGRVGKLRQLRVCGFHIHSKAWEIFRQQLMYEPRQLDIHHPELSQCPLFNYTFCTLFHVINSFEKDTLTVPDCFCRHPVVIQQMMHRGQQRIAFTCKNHSLEGTRPRCSWFRFGEDVHFYIPHESLKHLNLSFDHAKQERLPPCSINKRSSKEKERSVTHPFHIPTSVYVKQATNNNKQLHDNIDRKPVQSISETTGMKYCNRDLQEKLDLYTSHYEKQQEDIYTLKCVVAQMQLKLEYLSQELNKERILRSESQKTLNKLEHVLEESKQHNKD